MPLIEATESVVNIVDNPEGIKFNRFVTYESIPGRHGKRRILNWTVPVSVKGMVMLREREKYCKEVLENLSGTKLPKNCFNEVLTILRDSTRPGFIKPVDLSNIDKVLEVASKGDLFAAAVFNFCETKREMNYLRPKVFNELLSYYDMWEALKNMPTGADIDSMLQLEYEFLPNVLGTEGDAVDGDRRG